MSEKNQHLADAPEYNRSKLWQIILFTFNNTSTNLYLFSYSFITYYATGVVGVALLLVSSLMGGIRFFDGAIDPFIGVLIDKTESKFGKYRPIIILGNIITAISYVMVFSTHLMPQSAALVMLVASLLVHKIGYSLQASVTKAGQTVLTNDPQQRPLFAVFDGIFNIGVFTGGQIFISNYLQPKHGGFTLPFFTELSIIVILASFTLAVLASIGIAAKDRKEFFGLGDATVETKGFKDYWQVIKKNRPLQMLCLSASLDKLAVTIIGDAVIIVMLFGIFFGNYALSGQISAMTIVPDLLITFFCTWLARRSGLKKAFSTSIALSLLSFIGIGIFLFTLNDPVGTFQGFSLPVILFIIMYSAARSFGRTPTTLVITMTADVSDYETHESGRYVAGMIGTIFSFIDSLAASLGPVIVGWLSAWMGYTTVYPAVGDAMTQELFIGTILAISVIPAVLMVGSLLAMKFYSLDDKKMQDVQVGIANKKREAREKMALSSQKI